MGFFPLGADGLKSSTSVHPFILSAKSAALTAVPNAYRERSILHHLSEEGVTGQVHEGGGRDEPRSQCWQESCRIR